MVLVWGTVVSALAATTTSGGRGAPPQPRPARPAKRPAGHGFPRRAPVGPGPARVDSPRRGARQPTTSGSRGRGLAVAVAGGVGVALGLLGA